MGLEKYRAKRDFRKTPEPKGVEAKQRGAPIFVVQEHHASRLHYDFRLEADGVLKSWAVPKEPSMDPSQKRLAVHVEDHPVPYAKFEGRIPEEEYGAGTVSIWDKGTYENLLKHKPVPQNMKEAIDRGWLEFELHGQKLRGKFALIRMRGSNGKENWLLIKMKDEFAAPANGKRPTKKAATKRSSKRSAQVTRGARPPAEQTFTHTDKVLYPDMGITKADVLEYYRQVASFLLPYLRDRPCTLERLPEGIGPGKPHFWQKNTPSHYPAWIPRMPLPTEQGKTVQYVLVNDVQTLLYLVNQGALTFHTWFSRVEDLAHPDFVLFDLDRSEASFADLVDIAQRIRDILQSEKAEAYVKTSGKTGLHVLTPWRRGGYDEARHWAQRIAGRVAKELPKQATVEIRKAKRQGRVYIDTLENARGHHAVPPYVLRAVPGAPVSTPLHWRELRADTDSARYNLKTMPSRLRRMKTNPMAGLRS
jgi:bifunctional non-homologous end joining protein LigD